MTEDKKHSLEELQYMEQYNRTVLGKLLLENEVSIQIKLSTQLQKQQELNLKSLQLNVLGQKESLRPYRLMHAFVTYDPTERKYRCQLPEYIDLEDVQDSAIPIVTYGDTPAQACDNFDHDWVHGRTNI